MIWVYIVTWTLALQAGEYGDFHTPFQKKFMSKKEATEFIERAPKNCSGFEIDSTSISTNTEPKNMQTDTIYNWPGTLLAPSQRPNLYHRIED